MSRVFVAMSGGVDSSVAAALLLEQGHHVTGVTMQLWPSSDDEGGCCSVSAVRDARRVCDLLGIAHYVLNFREAFQAQVVVPFADEYAAGRTPNPCVRCNDVLKFEDLLARVCTQGADFLATGHYARIVRQDDSVPTLSRGLDPLKDQSYFLYRLTHAQMNHVLFPVGELEKSEVRKIAGRLGLHVASKPDSQEVCFAAAGRHAEVVGRLRPDAMTAGPIVDVDGRVVGTHGGIAGFTVGQRKGLGVAGPVPSYVLGVDPDTATVTVGPVSHLDVSRIQASDVVWHGQPARAAAAMIRYRMEPQAAQARREGDSLVVEFERPVRAVAPGQAVVCYQGDAVLGGGVIECAS
ncbi:MAG: tRNA 2-thiouridine(34) synthase MnmA [Coriobacteriia bacterium]|nr:tRNA 2-thiouridine(34) synthase MnmA [Coriobacteriia bacterium]